MLNCETAGIVACLPGLRFEKAFLSALLQWGQFLRSGAGKNSFMH